MDVFQFINEYLYYEIFNMPLNFKPVIYFCFAYFIL